MKNNSISFDTKRRATGAILGPVVAIFLWMLPIEALSDTAHHLLAIMSLAKGMMVNGVDKRIAYGIL